MSLRLVPPWTSSRWKPLPTLMFPTHIEITPFQFTQILISYATPQYSREYIPKRRSCTRAAPPLGYVDFTDMIFPKCSYSASQPRSLNSLSALVSPMADSSKINNSYTLLLYILLFLLNCSVAYQKMYSIALIFCN